MAKVDQVTIKGLKEIEQRLQKLPEKVRRKHLRGALKDGSDIVREDAEQRARKRMGKRPPHLADHVVNKVTVGANFATALVGINYKVVKHGHLVEFGTKAHRIGKRKHKGTDPHPFMRPAYDAKAENATDHIIDKLAKAIEKEV